MTSASRGRFFEKLLVGTTLAGALAFPAAALAQDNRNDGAAENDNVIVVTGSFIKRQADQASPVEAFGQDELSAIGVATPADLIDTLTINSGSQNRADGFNQSNSIGTSNANLRGLGVASTLVLLNGRRQTRSATATLAGDQFVDLSSLVPALAVARVEILKDGATSLYGSDAVAGVVNYITRDDFRGVEVDGGVIATTRDGQTDFDVNGLIGVGNDDVNIIAAISYFNRSPLSATARRDDFTSRDAFSVFGQPGTFLPLGGPLAFQRQPDPSCATQAAIDNSVVGVIPAGPIAGTCNFDFGDFFTLVAEEQRLLGFARLTANLSDSLEFFLEGGVSSTDVAAESTPSQPILFPPVITTANPANTFGAPALFFGRVLGAGANPNTDTYDSLTTRIAAGLKGEFGGGWSWETAVTHSSNNYVVRRGDTKVDAFNAAIACPNGPNDQATCYNPLFGAQNDPNLVNSILGTFRTEGTAKLTTFDAHVTGDVLDLPAGPLGVAFGVQYRKDELDYDYDSDTNSDNFFFNRQSDDFTGKQDVYAAFLELAIPVVDSLELQAAVRYEDFGGGNNTLDPKIGFLFQPVDGLSFRGTFGTSFRSPSIFQLNGSFSVPSRIVDAQSGGFATIAQTTRGDPNNPIGNQDSNTYNLGFTWDSDFGLSFGVDYWRFEYSNFITPENATALVAAVAADPSSPLAAQIIRAQNGTLLAVTSFYRNAGELTTDGLDINVSYDLPETSIGQFGIRANATRVLSYDLDDPVAGKIDGLGQRNFTNFGNPVQDWRINVGLGWESGVHSLNAFVRYVDSYVDENNANAKIESNTTVDVQYVLDVSDWVGAGDSGASITLGAKNLFDILPPDVRSRTGYDSLTGSPLGRQVYGRLKLSF